MGLPWTIKRKWNRDEPKKKKEGESKISYVFSRKTRHNWMILEREEKKNREIMKDVINLLTVMDFSLAI
jgi:hypothetical protein